METGVISAKNPRLVSLRALLALAVAAALTGCLALPTTESGVKGDVEVAESYEESVSELPPAPPEQPPENVAPVVNAGSDRTITLPTSSVSLSGTATDSDGTVVRYSWTKMSGPSSGTIASPTQRNTAVSALVQGTYVFRLAATDNDGATGSDMVNVVVNPAPEAPNEPPTANAGSDKTITLPTNSVTLTGTASDPENKIASRAWTKVSGPTAGKLAGTTTNTLSLTELAQGTYVFRFTVKDEKGATASDTVNVVVNAQPAPPPPPPPPPASGQPTITLREKAEATAAGARWGYGEYLPAGYESQSEWPLLLFMHGIGECEGQKTLEKTIASNGPIREARAKGWKLPMIILQPQSNCDWSAASVQKFVDFAFSKYKVDKKRFYVSGLSLGGRGVADYLDAHVDKVAAVVTICAAGQYKVAETPQKIADQGIGLWSAVAANDTKTGTGNAINMVTRVLKVLGLKNGVNVTSNYPGTSTDKTYTAIYDPTTQMHTWVKGQPYQVNGKDVDPPYLLTYYFDGGHNSWDRMYQDPNIYTWLLKFSRR